jgi:tetratricopeptide (TPR) repeat protein
LIGSTLLSPLTDVSFFGVEDNRSGYNLYDNISLFVIGLSIAIKFRSAASLKLLAYVLIATGTITSTYGIAQNFGWDPLSGNIGLSRVHASFGNPIDFGSYMVMTIPATLALAYFGKEKRYRWTIFTATLISLQLAGLWLTGSRGPYIATISSIILFLSIAISIGHIKMIIRPALSLFAGAVIAATIVSLPVERNNNDAVLNRVLNIESQFQDLNRNSNEIIGGLAGRINIWKPTAKLATQWNTPSDQSTLGKILHPIFGLGPDMFAYSFPLVAQPRTGVAIVDHTHNYQLQILMEQGFLGLIGFLTLVGSLAAMSVLIIRQVRHTNQPWNINTILVLALLPPMIGKIVEIQTGVARVSDLTMMFALFGATFALYQVINCKKVSNSQHQINVLETAQSKMKSERYQGVILASKGLLMVMVAVMIFTVFITWDLRRLSASQSHASRNNETSESNQMQALANSQSQAPERPSFTNELFTEYFHASIYLYDHGNKADGINLMLTARELLLEFEKHNPFKRDTQLNLLHTEVALIQWGYPEYTQPAVDRSQKIIARYPSYPSFVSMVATDMAVIGVNELAIEYADRAINVENVTQSWSKAWYAKGRALYQLGRTSEAIRILNTATEKRPGAEGAIYSHKLLAMIYKEKAEPGDSEVAEFHNNEGNQPVTAIE